MRTIPLRSFAVMELESLVIPDVRVVKPVNFEGKKFCCFEGDDGDIQLLSK